MSDKLEQGKIKIELQPALSEAAILAGLAGLADGLLPGESTRPFFTKLLSRAAPLSGARRLLIFEGRAAGRDPMLMAWYGIRPGQSDPAWAAVARVALEEIRLFSPDEAFYKAKDLEVPKIGLIAAPVQAYGQTLAVLLAAVPAKFEPNLLVVLAGQIGLHLYNRQATIQAAGQTARASHNQEQLTALFEMVPVAMLRAEGQLWRANPAAAALLGLSAEESLQSFPADRFSFSQADGFTPYTLPQLADIVQVSPLSEEAVILQRRKGGVVPLLLSVAPAMAEDGRVLGLYLVLKPA